MAGGKNEEVQHINTCDNSYKIKQLIWNLNNLISFEVKLDLLYLSSTISRAFPVNIRSYNDIK